MGPADNHKAARYGFTEIVERLIKEGADIEAVNKAGRTAYHYASSEDIAKIFYRVRANALREVTTSTLERRIEMLEDQVKAMADSIRWLKEERVVETSHLNQAPWRNTFDFPDWKA